MGEPGVQSIKRVEDALHVGTSTWPTAAQTEQSWIMQPWKEQGPDLGSLFPNPGMFLFYSNPHAFR